MDNTTATGQPKNISGAHCQSCGSTAAENISDLYDTEGYTRCCNERVVNHTDPTAIFAGRETCATSRDCYHD